MILQGLLWYFAIEKSTFLCIGVKADAVLSGRDCTSTQTSIINCFKASAVLNLAEPLGKSPFYHSSSLAFPTAPSPFSDSMHN